MGQQLRVDVQLADATRDELRELAAEIEHATVPGAVATVPIGPVVGGPVGAGAFRAASR